MVGTPAWKISGYVAEELLGYGAGGQVWRGRTSRSGHPVALKRIDCADLSRRRAAQAEAALLSALEHPHLVRLHELVPDGHALVLVLDLADGGSLADLLARRDRLTPGEVVTALSPVAAALAYAHDEGVTHCDVSAANVLFTAAGEPLLADLGVARLLGDASPPHATLAYLDPAVAAGAPPGPPSDVFALAGVALHALSGAPVWTGPSPEVLVAQAASGEILDLDERLAGVPAAVADVVRRGLSVEPYARGTAGEFALDLRHAAHPTPVELDAGRGRLGGQAADLPVSTGPHRARHARPSAPLAPAQGSPRPDWEWSFDRPGFARPYGGRVAPPVPASAMPARPAPSPRIASGQDPPDSSALPMTHAVRARVRPVEPPPGRLHRALGGLRSSSIRPGVLAGLAAMVVVAVLVAAVLWWRPWREDRHRAAAGIRSTRRPASAPATVDSPPPSPSVPRGWAAVLLGLDAERERAFATGDAAVLTKVYAPGALLRQDTAALTRVVPGGCRVVGLRTSYAGVVVAAQTAQGFTVRATASLARAPVMCGATVSSFTAAHAPVQMTIGLVSLADGYRIASLRVG